MNTVQNESEDDSDEETQEDLLHHEVKECFEKSLEYVKHKQHQPIYF